MSQVTSFISNSGPSGFVQTLTGNTEGAVSPTGGNINVVGDGSTITITGNPDTSTLTASLITPLTVPNGGTGDVSFTAYSVITGGTTSTGALQNVSGVGTSGQVLTSQGAAALPHWANAAASGIVTIDGDTDSVTGSTVTIESGVSTVNSGKTILFSGSGTTLTLNVTDSNYNTLIGNLAGYGLTSGANNTGIGNSALESIEIGEYNVALGSNTLNQLTKGTYNIAIGDSAGYNYQTTESSNICIGMNAEGTTSESNALHIGSSTGNSLPGQLNKAFISGINGITVSTADQILVINSSDQIGSVAHGTSGQILKTNGAGANPSWINVPSSSITITGDSGDGLTGSSFTFTGGTTGLTFSGAESTETLTGTLSLANGGTSASLTASNGGIFYSTASAGAILSGTATADQVLLSGSSTTPAWSTATYPATTTINQLLYSSANNVIGGVTAGNYGVLISSSSGVPSWLANGTTGQILTATASGTPSWEAISSSGGVTTLHSQDGNNVTPTSGTINISGGNSLTTTGTSGPNTITISLAGITQYNVQTGGSSNSLNNVPPGATSGVPLISQGSSTQPIFGTALVAGGGTGATTFTSHGVLLGNTTSAITATAAGTTGQVLTGVTGSAPTFQSPAASSISITGDSGDAQTGAAFTFTGGSTGLTFAGDTDTLTLGGTLVLANGGTSASLTASNGGIFYSTASAGAILSGTATAKQMLQSGANTTPAWSTSTWPATTTINQILYSSAANTVGGITAGNYGVLISSSAGVPSWLANGTTGQVLTATTSGTPSWQSGGGGSVTLDGDTGSATGSTITVKTGSATNANGTATFAGSGSTLTLSFTDEFGNVALGTNALAANTAGTSPDNVVIGDLAGQSLASGSGTNVIIGQNAANTLVSGSANVIIGTGAGASYVGTESGNILINDTGVDGEENTLRIASSQGGLPTANACYIGGIASVSSGTADSVVVIDSLTNPSQITSVPNSTTGFVFTCNGAGVTPSWQAIPLITVDGDSGTATGNPLTIYANQGSNNCGQTVNFYASGSTVTMNVTDGNQNTTIGLSAGYGAPMSGTANTGFGYFALNSLSNSSNNTAVGANSLAGASTGNNGNTAVGSSALFTTSGTLNTAVGYQSGYQISSANYNTLLGYRAGYGYTNSDSSNISIGTNGTESSPNSNVLKIGAGTGAGNFQLNKAFISGINGITVSTADQLLVINSSDQIGSVAHGTSGQILKTNGAGANPSWINVPSSSISITGNSGGALTGAAFTFTGGTTGLTFSGAGSTETLGGTLVLANGGTSASLTASNGGIFYSTASAGAILSGTSTANQMLQSGASTTPAWSTSTWPATTTINQLLYSSAANTVGGVTAGNYGVLISSSAGVPSWLANGTTGQILTATTSGTPSWEAISSSGGVTTLHSQDGNNVTPTTGTINISGGNSLTTTGTSGPNTITISLAGRTQYNVQTGGSSNSLNNVAPGATSGVPLISQGSSSQPIFGTALVAGGGTGATTLTSHGVLLGNTTSAITATAAGTTGQVLTGVTGSAPTFQSPAASSISITGDSGGALTGAAFTIYTNNASTNCGSSVLFSGSGSTLTFNVTDSSSNTLVGATSGNGSLTGHDNTSIGANTLLHLTSGIQNAGLGSGALKACTSGGNNIAQGQGSLQLLTTGSYNTCIGGATGQNYTSSESSNIQIGYNTLGTVSESNVLRIGAGTGTGNGQLNVAYISGITGIAVTGAAVLVSTGNQLGVAVSSRKYKENIHDMGDVSSQILSLRPVIFNYIGSDLAQHGLIAEEVAEIIPSLVVYDNQGDPQTVKYHELPALLLNELQKAFARIEALEAKLGDR